MANIAQPLRLPRQDVREQQTNAETSSFSANGTGINASILPNSRRDDAGDGQSQGRNGQGTDHQAAGYGRTTRAPVTEKPWTAGDSVLNNIGPFGYSTMSRGSMRRSEWDKSFASTQGKPIRLAGDMPNTWAQQIHSNTEAVRVQTRDHNPMFVAMDRYGAIRV